ARAFARQRAGDAADEGGLAAPLGGDAMPPLPAAPLPSVDPPAPAAPGAVWVLSVPGVVLGGVLGEVPVSPPGAVPVCGGGAEALSLPLSQAVRARAPAAIKAASEVVR